MNFDKAFDRLLGHEGGYVNNPKDPGKETKWGISKRSYPHLNIKDLTRDQAKEIYLTDFWNALGPEVHPAVKFQVFDFAVNSGISTAIRKLQDAAGVADDGHWGPVSAAALSEMELNDILLKFNSRRMRFITSLSKAWWDEFGRGVMNRIAGQLDYAAEDN